jgi:hypothetical protein
MVEGVATGTFAHVAGTFDLTQRTGTIDYVTPVRTAADSTDVHDEGIHLVGETSTKQRLFDQVVNPQRNSCAPHAQTGTYDEYIPVVPELHRIALLINGSVAAEYLRGNADAAGAVTLGAAALNSPHKFALAPSQAAASVQGVTYTVQAKADDEQNWQTIAVGLTTPNAEVDVNQFPGAKAVDVRVLQTDGFSETQVFQDTKKF